MTMVRDTSSLAAGRSRALAGDGRRRLVAGSCAGGPHAAAPGGRPHRHPGRCSRTARRGVGSSAPTLRVLDADAFFTRLGRDGLIGFGESYMAGDWDSDDLVALLTPMARNMGTLVPPAFQWMRRWYNERHPLTEENDRRGARHNIARHYDLSNDLFATFLDETMTYSSALLEATRRGARGRAAPQDPADPRHRRRHVGNDRSGGRHRLGRARAASRASAARDVTSVTLSTEQAALARERVRARQPQRPGRRPGPGLPRRRGPLRRDRQRRDDRGGRREVVADVLPHPRRPARAGRPDRPAGDPDAARPADGEQAVVDLDPQVHLPGRPAALRAGHRRRLRSAHVVAGGRPAAPELFVRRHPAAVARAVHRAHRADRRARLRCDLPADVDVLPRLLRGGIPGRLSQRRPADPGARCGRA